MDEQAAETSKFWTFIGKRSNAEAALADWRMELDGEIDFDQLQRSYLMPTGRMAEVIKCPFTCNSSCGFRNVRAYDGEYEAVCREWPLKSYCIGKADALFHTVKESALVEEVAKALSITPYMAKLSNHEHSWKVGNIIVRGESHSVFFTLQWDTELLELILDLNRLMHNPYVLLGSTGRVCNNVVAGCLDGNAFFVPLNETLDFNADVELELIRPFSWEKLLLSPEVLAEEPDNFFRKCGDAWEIRFDGGEKFMLTGVETGAEYIHHLLLHPNRELPVVNLVRRLSGDDCPAEDFEDMTDGFSINSLPAGNAGTVADSLAIRQYLAEERKLQHEIEYARNSGDNISLEQLQNDLETIRTTMNQAIGPSGRRKLLGDPELKVANSFRNAVNYAITRIAMYDEKLASHLRKSIKCGSYPEYSPGCDIDWMF